MSATFACWEPHLRLDPRSADFDERFYAIQNAQLPPTPTMLAFLDFVLAHYPEYSETASESENENRIWAASPLRNEISGAFMHVAVRWKFYTDARLFLRPAARMHGLDFYDPQSGLFVPANGPHD